MRSQSGLCGSVRFDYKDFSGQERIEKCICLRLSKLNSCFKVFLSCVFPVHGPLRVTIF